MQEYFTWELIATYTGAILAVAVITQFIKGLGFIKKIPTRVTAYVVAVVIMIAALFFTGTFTWSAFAITFVNAIVVALAANGTHDALDERPKIKIEASELMHEKEDPSTSDGSSGESDDTTIPA